jgi:hypothetical protein
MAGKKICLIVGEIGATQTPERATADWLMGKIIEPVIQADFPEYEVRHVKMVFEIDEELLDNLTHADLVIANLSGARPPTLYQVGMRQAAGLPIILMATTEDRPLFNLSSTQYIAFTPKGDVDLVRAALKEEIERVMAEVSIVPIPKLPASPKKTRLELAQRVETVADAIANLRINSASDHVQRLREIGRDIRDLSDEVSSFKDVAARVLPVLSSLFEALGTQQGAQVIVAGAVAGVLGAGGWPSVAIYGLTLAAWKGKDAFIAALDKLAKGGSSKRDADED